MDMEGPTDPSDWSFGPISDLDALLRCPICYEYFEMTVIVPQCSHNFCSLCIRRYLLNKRQCPVCSKAVTESELRCNRLLDQLVQSFTGNRQKFMELLTNNAVHNVVSNSDNATTDAPNSPPFLVPPPPTMSQLPDFEDSEMLFNEHSAPITTQRRPDNSLQSSVVRTESVGVQSHSERMPSNLAHVSEVGSSLETHHRSSSEVYRRQPLTRDGVEDPLIATGDADKNSSNVAPISSPVIIVCDSKENKLETNKMDDYSHRVGTPSSRGDLNRTNRVSGTPGNHSRAKESLSFKNNPKIKTVQSSPSVSSGPGLDTPSRFGGAVKNETSTVGTHMANVRVNCPSCGKEMFQTFINSHLDNCLNRSSSLSNKFPTTRPVDTNQLGRPAQRLPKLVFSVMNDKELRKRLKGYFLPTQGTKQVMIERLQEFTLRHNAQCDSLNPKTKREIAAEVEKAEREKAASRRGGTSSQSSARAAARRKSSTDPEEIEQQRKVHETTHADQYAKLIAQARESRAKIKAKGTTSTDTVTTNSTTPPLTPTTTGSSSQYFATPTISHLHAIPPIPYIGTTPTQHHATPTISHVQATPTQSHTTPSIHKTRGRATHINARSLTTPTSDSSLTMPTSDSSLTTPTSSKLLNTPTSGSSLTTPTTSRVTRSHNSSSARTPRNTTNRGSPQRRRLENDECFDDLSPLEELEALSSDTSDHTTRGESSDESTPELPCRGRAVLAPESPVEQAGEAHCRLPPGASMGIVRVPESPTISTRSLRTHGKRKHNNSRIRYSHENSNTEGIDEDDFEPPTTIRKKQRRV